MASGAIRLVIHASISIVLGFGGTALADEAGAMRVLYGGVEPGEEAAVQAARLAGLLATPGGQQLAVTHLDENVPAGDLIAAGTEESRSCAGDPVSADAYRASLDDLYLATTELRDTAPLIETTEASVPCLSEPVAPTDLARLPFLLGVVAHCDGDKEAATSAFERVFALDSSYEWNPEYPPDAQLCFANAGISMMRAERVPLRLVLPDGASAWVDGQPLEQGLEVQVVPGEHLVQVQAGVNGPLHGLVVGVAQEGATVLSRAVLDPTSPNFTTAIELLLASAEPPELVVWLAPELAAWERDADTGQFRPRSIPPRADAVVFGEPETGKPSRSAALPVLLGAGGATALAGALIAAFSGRDMSAIRADAEAGELPFAHPDDPDPTDQQLANKADFDRARTGVGVGVGLAAMGGAAMVISIPVGIQQSKHRVSVAAAVDAPQDGSTSPEGFHLVLTIR